jgi:hypothetical protein
MRIITFILILVIVCYIIMYTKPKLDTEIIQGSIGNITPELFLEKQPVLIYDKIVNVQDIIDTTFKYLYTFTQTHSAIEDNVYQSNSRYTLIHNTGAEDLIVYIVKSRRKHNHLNAFYSCLHKDTFDDSKRIEIPLSSHNVLVLPYLFLFKASGTVSVSFLNDITHIISP